MIRLLFSSVLLLTLLWGLPFQASAQESKSTTAPPKITWLTNTLDGIRRSQASGRPLLVYCTADFCGYCRKMDRETWADPDVARRIRDGYVAVKLDAEKHGELLRRVGIRGFPTTIIFDHQGQHLHTLTGFVSPSSLRPTLAVENNPGSR